jgi:ABC-type multidrug transport system fused ATPase/permease subunit
MFVSEPDLYVMDDFSSALDVETEEQLWKRLDGLAGATCLVVSHRQAATSTWTLTADSYISAFNGNLDHVVTNGHTLYINGVAANG